MYFDLNYVDIIKNYLIVMEYCLKSSDSFSVITRLKTPYSKDNIICEHDKVFLDWNSCLIKQIIGIKEWPGTETEDEHMVMNVYDSNKFRLMMDDIPNLFLPIINELPEDVCFYRNGTVWLATVSHEEMAFISFATKEDKEFFKQNGIRYYK